MSEVVKHSLRTIQLSNYVKPPIVEEMGKDWVLNGKNNGFFKYIIDRYNGSPTNAALIDAYTDRIYGRGLSIVNAKQNASEYVRLLTIIPKKELRKIVHDFYTFGSATLQIRYGKDSKRSIAKIEHLERILMAPNKMNKKGEIPGYWFCSNWSKAHQLTPEFFPTFGTSKKDIEVYEIKPYSPGKTYFADPSYLPALQYANLEEEISNFSINHIKNGLSAGWIINFPNGVPPEEVQKEIEKKIYHKLSGSSNAGVFILNFSDGNDLKPEIVAIPQNANHEQWQFWADEARQQILVGHRVTTPMLFGVKDNTGLGNNANEMEEGNRFLEKYSVGPHQNEIIDALQEIVQVNNIGSPLIFLPLEEEDEKEAKVEDKEPPNEEEIKMSRHLDSCADDLILLGEDEEQEGWECIMTEDVDYLLEDIRDKLLQFATTGTAIPNASSQQDSPKFKIRYQYAPLATSSNSREFCRKMVAAAKVYRKEDIIRMGDTAVNPGWGPGGVDNYSIWLYKGGGDCHHKWQRKTYVKKAVAGEKPDVDVKSPLAELISTGEARRRGDKTRNEREVSMRPTDMPNNGFLKPRR